MKNDQFDNFQLLFNALDIKIVEHGYVFGDMDWQKRNVCSPFNRLYFILESGARLEDASGNATPLVRDSIYLIPIQSTYHYLCDQPFEKFYIHFRLDYLPGRDIFEFNQQCMRLSSTREEIQHIVDLVKTKKVEDKLILKAELYKLLSRFVIKTEISYDKIALYLQYKDLFQQIEAHCYSDTSLHTVANQLGINENTLRKKFKEDMGVTVKQYIDLAVIERAKELMITTDLNLKELAYQLHFKDEFYFSRFFKKKVGCPPKQYRINNSTLSSKQKGYRN